LREISFEISTEYEGVFIFDVDIQNTAGCMQRGGLSDTIARVHAVPYNGKWISASFEAPAFHPMYTNQIGRIDVAIRPVNPKNISLLPTTPTHLTLSVRHHGDDN
jgi:hypothetical protein